MTYIGIDISKATFVAAYLAKNGYKTRTFKNNAAGCRQFIQTLNKDEHHCVMEATGNYGFLLLYLLDRASIRVSMENPKKIKNFARTMMSVTKTDEADARLIAMYGERMTPPVFKMPQESIMLLKQKRTALRQLRKQYTANRNLFKSLEVLPKMDPTVKKALDKVVIALDKQIKILEADLAQTAQKEFDKQVVLLTSIKGIGVTMASALIIATGGFTYFDNAKQVSKFLGLCPTIQKSGTSINYKGHINRNGDTQLRAQLYVASWNAIQYNTACKNCFNRLRQQGKPSKLALIAVANKLVRQAFSVVKSGKPYVDGFVSTKPSSIPTNNKEHF